MTYFIIVIIAPTEICRELLRWRLEQMELEVFFEKTRYNDIQSCEN